MERDLDESKELREAEAQLEEGLKKLNHDSSTERRSNTSGTKSGYRRMHRANISGQYLSKDSISSSGSKTKLRMNKGLGKFKIKRSTGNSRDVSNDGHVAASQPAAVNAVSPVEPETTTPTKTAAQPAPETAAADTK